MKDFQVSLTKPDVSVIENCIPNIYISKKALIKMGLYIDMCDNEVGWLGTAYRDKNNIYIDDMMLFDQEVSSVTTDIDDEALSAFGEELLQQENGVEIWNNIRVWGHSHVKMAVNPSSTDDKQMEEFENIGHDWFVRIIGNKNGSLRVDLYMYDIGVVYKKMPWKVLYTKEELEIIDLIEQLEAKLVAMDDEIEDSISDEVKEDIKKKVREKNSVVTINKLANTNYYNNNNKKNKSEAKTLNYYNNGVYGYTDSQDIYFDVIHQQNIDFGLYSNWVAEVLAECKSCDDAREALEQCGFEGMYDIYEDYHIEELMDDMNSMYFIDNEHGKEGVK
jgi:hypothetical protein